MQAFCFLTGPFGRHGNIMASEDLKKKWGTIFMGNREASVEQLNAMQEPLYREQRQREQAEDYMERVRARAADRAREILGAAYAERQKVLEEARLEATARKKKILADCANLRSEAENDRKLAQAELARAEAQRKQAEEIRKEAHDQGYKEGIEEAGRELQDFRLELGQALGTLLRALEWQQTEILKNWRDDLVTLVQCAAQAGAGFVLSREHEAIMRGLVFQALDLLESRRAISLRVNPTDEAQVADLFRAARERYPELGQWIVTGDEKIEKGGLIAESGSGSVDLKRENFREMVDGILAHLGLPEGVDEARYEEMVREIVEREASRITSLTPELDLPEAPIEASLLDNTPQDEPVEDLIHAPEPQNEDIPPHVEESTQGLPETEEGYLLEATDLTEPEEPDEQVEIPPQLPREEVQASDPSLAELEEELFPLEEASAPQLDNAPPVSPPPSGTAEDPVAPMLELEPETLARGGFL